jgi:hypothetical protein
MSIELRTPYLCASRAPVLFIETVLLLGRVLKAALES